MPHTEYVELPIPLGFRITPVETTHFAGQVHLTAASKADPIIRKRLAEARLDGWELAEPISFVQLAIQNKVQYYAKYGAITGEWKYSDYISVRLTLQRVVP